MSLLVTTFGSPPPSPHPPYPSDVIFYNPLTKSVSISLQLTAASSVANAGIHKKFSLWDILRTQHSKQQD